MLIVLTGLINKAWKNLYYESGVPEKDTPQSLSEWSEYVHERGDADNEDEDEDSTHGVAGDQLHVSTSNTDIGLQGKELLQRVIFKNANIVHCDLRNKHVRYRAVVNSETFQWVGKLCSDHLLCVAFLFFACVWCFFK